MSPTQLVQDVLLGSGVTVSNITFSGAPISIGSFTYTGTNLGLGSGVIMTTGTIQNTGDGPQGPNNSSSSGMNNAAGGYPPLSAAIGGTATYNAAVLEFDFIPYSDMVQFRYVFGSEEYPEYVNSQFNDVFAFYISGPGIVGMQNMALLPSGQVVAINNVNNGTGNVGPCNNCAFYVNNGDGTNGPYNSSAQYIQYDGYTTVLTAQSNVQCGQQYHLTIAIADAGDEIYDSGIFLEANSLSSNTPVEMSHQLSEDLFGDPDIMAEGCVSTTVTLERGENDLSSPLTVPIIVSGTATENLDYSDIPADVTFPAGVQTVSFNIDAFADALVEGQESIILTLPLLDPCGNSSPVVLELFIEDVQPLDVTLNGTQMECPGEEVTISSTITGGLAPYDIQWSNGETTPNISVNPTTTTTYSISVSDYCTGSTVNANFEVIVPVITPIILTTTPDITEICPYLSTILTVSASGGSGSYSYQWSSSTNPNLGTGTQITVTPASTTTYTVTVSDGCGNGSTADILYTITSPPLVVTMSNDLELCPGDSAFISASVSGGYGQYFYNWPQTGETTPGIWVYPEETTNYIVNVSDECQTFSVPGSVQVAIVKPTADFSITSGTFFTNLPIQFVNLSSDAVTYVWDFGDGNMSTDVHPQNTYLDEGIYYIELVAIDEKGCTDTIVKPIGIEEEWYVYIPNSFTADNNRLNDVFRVSTFGVSELTIDIYNRWGERIYTSNELDFAWDGTFEGEIVPDGTYTYNVLVKTNSGREEKFVGHVNVLK